MMNGGVEYLMSDNLTFTSPTVFHSPLYKADHIFTVDHLAFISSDQWTLQPASHLLQVQSLLLICFSICPFI